MLKSISVTNPYKAVRVKFLAQRKQQEPFDRVLTKAWPITRLSTGPLYCCCKILLFLKNLM